MILTRTDNPEKRGSNGFWSPVTTSIFRSLPTKYGYTNALDEGITNAQTKRKLSRDTHWFPICIGVACKVSPTAGPLPRESDEKNTFGDIRVVPIRMKMADWISIAPVRVKGTERGILGSHSLRRGKGQTEVRLSSLGDKRTILD